MMHVEKRYLEIVAQAMPYKEHQIESVLKMLEEGNTVPFIARYRKERTGSLDEVQIKDISDAYQRVEKIEKKRSDIEAKIGELGKLTEKLKKSIEAAETMQQLEDLYLPYRQKRRTKAQAAKEAGLEPFALWMLTFQKETVESKARAVARKSGLEEAKAAIDGAMEILAEKFGENSQTRQMVRDLAERRGKIVAVKKKNAEDAQEVYKNYYEFEAPAGKLTSYQVLALDRGEKQGILRVKLELEDERILNQMHRHYAGNHEEDSAEYVKKACDDAYKRFIKPAIERELRNNLTAKADVKAIEVFGDNLYHLLMQAPLKGRVVLGLDPAYRTGCKLAVVDETGKFLDKAVIYPHEKYKGEHVDQKRVADAKKTLRTLIRKYGVRTIAIGNGTASRESESFVANVLREIDEEVSYVIVNEAGASVYSASETARREFPDFNVEERSAVSIARRLQDPLAELIKIDPKAIGVGQYQHDLPERDLDERLRFVIETGVNKVGVNLNTASPQLLEHISGLNATTAQNIVDYRSEIGRFEKRSQLKKVKRLGDKAFEQAAGFLRIPNGSEPLDNTDIHPESYGLARRLLKELGMKNAELSTKDGLEKLRRLDPNAFAKETGAGVQTIEDIVESLKKPGRDLRDSMQKPLLRSDVLHLEDLKEGMKLQGTVRNVVDFGAFVDIGVKQDGLVHISKLKKGFVKNPSDVVSVGDIVDVWIDGVDEKRGRIQLTMVDPKDE